MNLKRRRAALKAHGRNKKAREEWRRVWVGLMRRSLGLTHVLRQVVTYLNFDETVAFHDAFPEISDIWEGCNLNYASWLVPHLTTNKCWLGQKMLEGGPYAPVYYKNKVSLNLNDPDFDLPVEFETYVQFYHWHTHAVHSSFYPTYKTYATNGVTMVPSANHISVISCTFLPSSSPGIFSSNLVILGTVGEVRFYSTGITSFRLVAKVDLDVCPQGLLASPKGHLLLAHSSEPYTVVFRLTEDHPVAEVTKIRLDDGIAHPSIFVDETSFITWGLYTRQVMLHTVRKGKAPLTSFFYKPPPWLAAGDTDGCSTTFFLYTPPRAEALGSPAVPEYLLFGQVSSGQGLVENLLTCAVSPRDRARVRHHYIRFDGDCGVCSFAPDPERRFTYVGCLFDDLEDSSFTSPYYAPKIVEAFKGSAPPSIDLVRGTRGHIAVYRLGLFAEGGEVRVTPRFSSNSKSFGMAFKFLDGSLLKMICTKTHLAVKLADRDLCHFSLIAATSSSPYYESYCRNSQVFAVSEDHKCSCFLLTTNFKNVVEGRRECTRYEKVSSDAKFKPFWSSSPAVLESVYL
jgi:hypothetical protein